MILPSDNRCREVLDLLDADPALSTWERAFIESNRGRVAFTDAQKQVIARLVEKFEV